MTALDGWTIAANEVPDAGKRFARTANEAERQALACELGIIAVTAFDCDVRVKPLRSGRFHVKGTLKAAVEQACVVSLEPVAGTVEEAIDVEFWPQDQIAAPKSTAEDEWLDPQAPDEAEPIENGRIEVGRLAFEILLAGLDPYPRKPGAKLEFQEPPEAQAAVHPFAALAKLKQPKS